MYSLMGGMKSAKHLRTFLRPENLNPLGFFIHESERLAFLLVTQEGGRGVGHWRWAGASSHPLPCPIGEHPSSASMKDPKSSHKKRMDLEFKHDH